MVTNVRAIYILSWHFDLLNLINVYIQAAKNVYALEIFQIKYSNWRWVQDRAFKAQDPHALVYCVFWILRRQKNNFWTASTVDQHPRIFTLRMHAKLSIAYHWETAKMASSRTSAQNSGPRAQNNDYWTQSILLEPKMLYARSPWD